MSQMPESYRGREQTWLKHRVLKQYVEAWAHKLASFAPRLWFVDCFAGPWRSADTERGDTSIAIGLAALNTAAASRNDTASPELNALFVEKNPAAFKALKAFAPEVAGNVRVEVLHGAFGEHVDAIDRMIGDDHAFVFVDPTGWDGAAMDFIAKLANGRHRDVMVNVMYGHLQRFKDDQRTFLREQMREFFGLGEADLPARMSEDALMKFYRDRLQAVAGLDFVADLAVPVPTKDRTQFRLVVGGHHPMVVQLFRDVERRVVGKEAAGVRAAAKSRKTEQRTRQPTLLGPAVPSVDAYYTEQRALAVHQIRSGVPTRLAQNGSMRFGDLWPRILCACHITLGDLKAVIGEMHKEGVVVIDGVGPGARTVKDDHMLRLPGTGVSGGLGRDVIP